MTTIKSNSSTGEQETGERGWSKADTNGVYWWRYDSTYTPEIVEVRDGLFYSVAEPDPTSVSVGEFLGPVNPEQVEALKLLVVRLEKMMENGPECDCPAEGHMCGWPALSYEVDAARAALGETK